MHTSATTKHLPRLDSLRGLAALMVAGHHGFSMGGTPIEQQIVLLLGFFMDGRIGVCIFFVLSGLVLGMSLRRLGPVTVGHYSHFCIRRFFRLYPAYAVSSLFYLLLHHWITTRAWHGQWIGHGWFDFYVTSPLTKTELLENFLFSNQCLNGVTWTLKVEAQAALILPLLHLFSLRFRGRYQLLLLLVLIAFSFASPSNTRSFLYLFYLGYLIPPMLEKLRTTQVSEQGREVGGLLCAALALLAISHVCTLRHFTDTGAILNAALGSTLLLLLILFAPSNRLFSWLDHAPIRFMGRISYSFYLFNLLCLDILSRSTLFLFGKPSGPFLLNMVLLFISTTAVCAGISWLSYTFVERPSVKLGSHF